MRSSATLRPAVDLRAAAGPVAMTIRSQTEGLERALLGVLRQFDVRWARGGRDLRVIVRLPVTPRSWSTRGDYLRTYRIVADRTSSGLRAHTPAGASCAIDDARGVCRIWSPRAELDIDLHEELEQLLMLFIVRAWRLAGWTPLHAASAVRGGVGLAVCALGGTGKTTLISALLRRGWRTIGDDKLLVRRGVDGGVEVRAVSHQFHMDPGTSRFFPEIHGIEEHPTYSRWTPKRQVPARRFWPDQLVESGTITHVVRLARDATHTGIRMEPMSASETLSTLLTQVVIPNEPREARMIVSTLGSLASKARGIRCTVGKNAYADDRGVRALEEALK